MFQCVGERPPPPEGLFNFLSVRPHTHDRNDVWQRSVLVDGMKSQLRTQSMRLPVDYQRAGMFLKAPSSAKFTSPAFPTNSVSLSCRRTPQK